MRRAAVGLLAVLVASPALAQEPKNDPETCLVAKRGVVVEHAGKPYRLRDDACREEFLSDPERFAQLYDAIAELRAAGQTVTKSESLVPS